LKVADSDAGAKREEDGSNPARLGLMVLEAAVPTYACCGWGGPSDGRGEIEGRERTRGDPTGVVPRRRPVVLRPRDIREEYGMVVRGRAGDR
jgi:hypothetical protein